MQYSPAYGDVIHLEFSESHLHGLYITIVYTIMFWDLPFLQYFLISDSRHFNTPALQGEGQGGGQHLGRRSALGQDCH